MVRKAEMAKAEGREHCSDTRVVITVDLQNVLLCPRLLALSVYYKWKLQEHNFSVFFYSNDKYVTL